ncbi:MAG: SpoIIE family protein phosphatase, partial [Bacteroidales bacterium]
NEIVNTNKIFKPSSILYELNKGIIASLNQGNMEDESQNDGMDITLCRIDMEEKIIELSCANHVVFLVNNDEIQMIEGDIHSIGGMFAVLKPPTYSDIIFPIQQDTAIYMFSDGFQDQFSGTTKQKFMLNRLKELIFSLRKKTMNEQLEHLRKAYFEWKGEYQQIDDILVMGIKFHN